MATIDYKEKYEQALERAKYYHDRDNIQFLENIFQELKGSEGERIRKELLDFCKNRAEKYSNDPKYKNISAWISWLEKQGICECTKFTEKKNDVDFKKLYIKISSNVLEKLLENEKFEKDIRIQLFDKGQDVSSIYDIYAKEAIKYVKALFKQIENEY